MKTPSESRTVPPCPPNGLSRAQWFRWLAAELEDRNPERAASCRATAARIEQGAFGALPLCRAMTETVGVALVAPCRPDSVGE